MGKAPRICNLLKGSNKGCKRLYERALKGRAVSTEDQEATVEFLDSRIWRLGTITGRGFLDRRIWKQGSIKKRGEVNIRAQVGGSGCAIRGGGGTLKQVNNFKKKPISKSRRRRQVQRESTQV